MPRLSLLSHELFLQVHLVLQLLIASMECFLVLLHHAKDFLCDGRRQQRQLVLLRLRLVTQFVPSLAQLCLSLLELEKSLFLPGYHLPLLKIVI